MPEHATKRASRGVTCLYRDRDDAQHPIGTLETTRAVIAPPKTAVTSPNRWIEAKRAPIKRRIAYLESMLEPEQVARAEAARRVAKGRLIIALTRPGPQQVSAAEAERRAISAAQSMGRGPDELGSLRERLAGLT